MTDADVLRILFTVALVLWLTLHAAFTPLFFRALRRRGLVPFVTISTVLAISNLAEAATYCYVLWFEADNRLLVRAAFFAIPTSLIVRAVLHGALVVWVLFYGGHERAREGGGER